jgi:hypothetical protein
MQPGDSRPRARKARQTQVGPSAWRPKVAETVRARVRDKLLARLVLRPGERWLDLTTCTGPIALRAARVAAQVSAQDLFPARGPRLAGAQRLSVRFKIGDAERLPPSKAGAAALPDGSPDGVRHNWVGCFQRHRQTSGVNVPRTYPHLIGRRPMPDSAAASARDTASSKSGLR